MTDRPLLDVQDLTVAYDTPRAPRHCAVDHVGLTVHQGEFTAVVGESGCGKSTLMFAVAGLLSPPARITTGTVRFRGDDLVTLTERELDALRWRDFSVVLQSAMNALNPVATLAAQYKDAMAAHARTPRTRSGPLHRGPRTRRHRRRPPAQLPAPVVRRHAPTRHDRDGVAAHPRPRRHGRTRSALDVVAQRSLMVQIKELQQPLGFAVVFVTHDMSLVSHFSDQLLVMYAGQVVEAAPPAPPSTTLPPLQPGPPRSLPVDPRPPRPHKASAARPTWPRRRPAAASRAAALVQEQCHTTEPALYGSARHAPAACCTRPPRRRSPHERTAAPDARPHPPLQGRHRSVRRVLHAVDDVDLTIGEREIVALVGESGSGRVHPRPSRRPGPQTDPRRDPLPGKAADRAARPQGTPRLPRRRPHGLQDPSPLSTRLSRLPRNPARPSPCTAPELSRAERQAEAERVVEEPPASRRRRPRPLPVRTLRRPAPAHRLRPGPSRAHRPRLILADEPCPCSTCRSASACSTSWPTCADRGRP